MKPESKRTGGAKKRRAKFPVALKVVKSSPGLRQKGPKPVRGGTKTKGAYRAGGNGVHVFRFADLELIPVGGPQGLETITPTRAP